MKIKRKKRLILLVIILSILAVVLVSSAIYQLTSTSRYICDYSPYKRVYSTGGSYMVPTGSSADWASFVNNYPSGVGIYVYSISCCYDFQCGFQEECQSGSCVYVGGGGECITFRDCLNLYNTCGQIMECDAGGNCCLGGGTWSPGCPPMCMLQ